MYPRRRYLLKSIFFAKSQTYQGIPFLNSQPILWHFFGPSSQCVREAPFCNVARVYGQCPNSFVPTNIPGKHSDHHHPRPPINQDFAHLDVEKKVPPSLKKIDNHDGIPKRKPFCVDCIAGWSPGPDSMGS